MRDLLRLLALPIALLVFVPGCTFFDETVLPPADEAEVVSTIRPTPGPVEASSPVDVSPEREGDQSTTDVAAAPADRPGPAIRCVPAPADTESVWFAPLWEVGVVRELVEFEGWKFTRAGASQDYVEKAIRLEVVDAVEGAVTFDWTAPSTEFRGTSLPVEGYAMLADLGQALPDSHFVYRMTPTIELDRVDNSAEIFQTIVEIARTMQQHLPEVVAASDFKGVDAISDEMVRDATERTVMPYHRLEGYELKPGVISESSDEIADPFSDGVLPATTRIKITELVDADGCVGVALETRLDKDASIPIMMASMASLMGITEAQVDALFDFEAIELTTLVSGQYDLGTDRFGTVTTTSVVSLERETRTSTSIIVDVTDG